MRAAIYQGKESIELKELDNPVCGENDVIVKNLYASICGTDVAVYKHGTGLGHRITIGGEFGHEAISEVVEVGSNIKEFQVGDVVYPYPREAKGDPRRAGTMGAFSEFMLIPDAKLNKHLYKLPKEISPKEACLIEPFTVGCRAARRGTPKQGEHALVYGAGTIGIAAAISLRHFGCEKVMICDPSDYRLSIARQLGFAVCNNFKEDVKETASAYFGSAPSLSGPTADVDLFIDAAGASSILEEYQAIGKIESRMVMVAVGDTKRPVDLLSMTFSQHALIGSGGYLPEDVADILAIMKSKEFDLLSIITHEYAWEQLPEAIEKASQTDTALNVIIHY